MKKPEEIEAMDLAELEEAALNEVTSVPEGLAGRIRETLAARAAVEEASAKPLGMWVGYASLAVAAALAALLLIPHGGPALKDTFDDPLLAYARTEQALRMISDKMSKGIEMAGDARATAGKTLKVFNNTDEK